MAEHAPKHPEPAAARAARVQRVAKPQARSLAGRERAERSASSLRGIIGQRIQPRLEVSRPADADEVEAERVADRVSQAWPAAEVAVAGGQRVARVVERVRVQRAACPTCKSGAEDCETCRVNRVQRKAEPSGNRDDDEDQERRVHRHEATGGLAAGADAAIEHELAQPSGGSGLPAPLRVRLESQFAADFRSVRVHSDGRASRLNRQLSARAFTYGRDIYFAPGEYQPSSPAGVRLLAHELTHVIQQGAAAQDIPRGAGQVKLPDARGPPSVATNPASIRVQRAAQSDAPASAEGATTVSFDPLAGLRARVLDAVTDGIKSLVGALPPVAIEQARTTFQALAVRGAAIWQALKQGDCKPLFQALGDLRELVQTLGVDAWATVTDFLAPKVAFFTRLWNAYGAEPLAALQALGGEAWQKLVSVGGAIADFGANVWGGIKQFVGGQASQARAGTSFIGEQAATVWKWIKEQTRPIWEPIATLSQRVGVIAPPSFIANLGKRCTEFGQSLLAAQKGLGDGGSIAENREALAQVLPALDLSLDGVSVALEGARGIVVDAVKVGARAARDLMTSLRSGLLGALAGPLGWVEKLVIDLEQWLADGVVRLFGFVSDAFNRLKPFLRDTLEVAKALGSVLVDFYALPVKLLGRAWNAIPECLRSPVQQFVVEQILGRMPLFALLGRASDAWEQIQAVGLRVLKQVFVDRNLPRALWTMFQEILRLLGIPPELVVQMVVKVFSAFGDILQNPLGFLGALLSGILGGFTNFGSNILEHLKTGVVNWLLSACAEAKLELPREFTVSSVFEFVTRALDITLEHFFERMAENPDIGPEVVAKLRKGLAWAGKAWEFVQVLNEEGIAGLGRLLQERLGGLWEQVLGGAIGWIDTKIIQALLLKLVASAATGPIGPLINAVTVVYEGIKTVRKHQKPVLAMVDHSLDAVAETAKGNSEPAAAIVEQELAGALPIAIDFIAQWLNLGNIGGAIRGIIEALKEKVTAAMDWLIEKAIEAGRTVLDGLRKAARALLSWWQASEPVSVPGEKGHTLKFDDSQDPPVLMIHSVPQTYSEFMATVTPGKHAEQHAKALATAKLLDLEIAKTSAKPSADPSQAAVEDEHAQKIPDLLRQLAKETTAFLKPEQPAIVFGGLVGGNGSTATVVGLGRDANFTGGSKPSAEPVHWCRLNQRRQRESAAHASYYVRGHLLNHNLGGTGAEFKNLTPITRKANSAHLHDFESAVKEKAKEKAKERVDVTFSVVAIYGRSMSEPAKLEPGGTKAHWDALAQVRAEEQNVPTELVCHAESADGKWTTGEVKIDNTVDTSGEYRIDPNAKCNDDL